MWRRSAVRLGDSRFAQTLPDGRRFNPRVTKEHGVWLYTKDSMDLFQRYCAENLVKARGNIKIAGSAQYSRALRCVKPVNPGQAVITMPVSIGFNFLSVSRLMFDVPNQMPMQVNWMNWNERLPFLTGAATHEIVTAGWMCRMNSLAESEFYRFIQWLLLDTAGRDGISSGISQDRGDKNDQVDLLLTNIANDACEEAEEFMEHFFRSLACLMHRAIPLEASFIPPYLNGTNFFKGKATEMFIPTLFPLIDCVPQWDDGLHNSMVDFISPERMQDDAIYEQLEVPKSDFTDPKFSQGILALRALEPVEPGNYFTLRAWPKTDDHDNERVSNVIMNQTRRRADEQSTF